MKKYNSPEFKAVAFDTESIMDASNVVEAAVVDDITSAATGAGIIDFDPQTGLVTPTQSGAIFSFDN